jgi:hypothetical protein
MDTEAYANLNGFGEKCYHCNGFGHYARECPQKGKGKGKSKGSKGKSFGKAKGKGFGKSKAAPYKGKGKGYSKGKGKGPVDGCFTCGGEHYASACPNGAQRWASTDSLRTLCCLKEVEKEVEEEVEENGGEDGFKLVQYKRRRANVEPTKVVVAWRTPDAPRSRRPMPRHQAGGGEAEAAEIIAVVEKSRQERAAPPRSRAARPGSPRRLGAVSTVAARAVSTVAQGDDRQRFGTEPHRRLHVPVSSDGQGHESGPDVQASQGPKTKAQSAVSTVAARAVRTVAHAASPKGPKGRQRVRHESVTPVALDAHGLGRSLVAPESKAGQAKRSQAKPSKKMQGLQSLQTIYPEGVNSVAESGDWEEIELAVDSGATETVVGEEMLHSIKTTEGEAFKRGVEYEVANGVTIPNLGEKCFVAVAEEGQRRKMKAQVCAVNKALLSVSRMVQAGNRVVFEQSGSYVEDLHSGEKMYMYEKGGMYMLKMWVEKGF